MGNLPDDGWRVSAMNSFLIEDALFDPVIYSEYLQIEFSKKTWMKNRNAAFQTLASILCSICIYLYLFASCGYIGPCDFLSDRHVVGLTSPSDIEHFEAIFGTVSNVPPHFFWGKFQKKWSRWEAKKTPRTCSLFGSFGKGWRHRHAGPEWPSRPCRYTGPAGPAGASSGAMGGGSTSSSSSSSSSGSKQKRKQRDDDINVPWMMEDRFFCWFFFFWWVETWGSIFCGGEVDGIWWN